jgi:2-amino-4-hydroxy-6-hydroxymethyldihydropteridine diphosphokinase
MKKHHKTYLNIGSNIQPGINLPRAIDMLRDYGKVLAVSNAWESRSIGASGPNFLNASILFVTPLTPDELKTKTIRVVETALGRVRSKDKNAPRTIDIDIIMVDDEPCNLERWNNPFVVVPMSELAPNLRHPIEHQKLSMVAERMCSQTWIRKQPGVLRSAL